MPGFPSFSRPLYSTNNRDFSRIFAAFLWFHPALSPGVKNLSSLCISRNCRTCCGTPFFTLQRLLGFRQTDPTSRAFYLCDLTQSLHIPERLEQGPQNQYHCTAVGQIKWNNLCPDLCKHIVGGEVQESPLLNVTGPHSLCFSPYPFLYLLLPHLGCPVQDLHFGHISYPSLSPLPVFVKFYMSKQPIWTRSGLG